MKTIHKQTFTTLVAAALIAITISSASAFESSERLLGVVQPAPTTAEERLRSLQSRHHLAHSELTATLNRLPVEPEFLGTKELFANIDKSAREMKNIRAGCTSLISTIHSEIKTVTVSSSFNESQKEELKAAAEALEAECRVLAAKLDLAIERLGAAYVILPKWNRVFKSYRNLQGQDKASQQVKAQVNDYLQTFIPETKQVDSNVPLAEGEQG